MNRYIVGGMFGIVIGICIGILCASQILAR
jgi:hypothetical protein